MPKKYTAKNTPKILPVIDMSDHLRPGINFPDEVPVLTSKDMHQGAYNSPDGERSCLLGHARRLAPPHHNAATDELRLVVERAVNAHVFAIVTGACADTISFNDRLATPTLAAKVWNAAMRDLGYTEGNPQA